MINVNNIIRSALTKSTTGLSTTDLLKISQILNHSGLSSVGVAATYSDLPVYSTKLGQMYLVQNENIVYYANATGWWSASNSNQVKLWAWGQGTSGQLGNGTTNNNSSPISVLGNLIWKTVDAAFPKSAAINSDDTIWTWGLNSNGDLGDGTTINRSSPVSLIAPANSWTWKQVAMRWGGITALRSDNTIWSWGQNNYGSSGDGTTTTRSSPVSVIGSKIWNSIYASEYKCVALDSNLNLWAWGLNSPGNIGDGTTINKSSPVSLIAPANSWTWNSASLGEQGHCLSIRSDGTMWTWGYNNLGQLGDGTTINKSSPVSLIAPANSWTWNSAAGGDIYSVAIKSDSTLWAWGIGNWGHLGDGTTTNKSSPVSVIGGFTWKSVDAASGRFCAGIKSDDTLWVWGRNNVGQLGDGTTTNKSSPISVINPKFWKTVKCKGTHVLAISIENL